MEIKDKILDRLTQTQKYAILLLGANHFKPLPGKTWFQKELFLISNNIEALKKGANFEPDFMGPYSEDAKEALDRLLVYGVVDKKEPQIKLTELGRSIFEIIYQQISEEQREIVSDFKELLNDMDFLELLGFIYLSYPGFINESVVKEKVFPKRKEIALKLFMKDKISMSKASEMANVPLEEFIQMAKSRGLKIYSE